MSSIFQSVIPESDYEQKRKIKQIEAIRDFATILENLYDRLEEKTSCRSRPKQSGNNL